MKPDPITYTSGDDARTDELAAIHTAVTAFNNAAAPLDDVRPLVCLARLSDGTLVGGAIARTWGGCCELQQLWVEEAHRRCGIGRELVGRIEHAASNRGCTVIYLETFSFQAPTLYRKLGYAQACELTGFPDGITKLLMQKAL